MVQTSTHLSIQLREIKCFSGKILRRYFKNHQRSYLVTLTRKSLSPSSHSKLKNWPKQRNKLTSNFQVCNLSKSRSWMWPVSVSIVLSSPLRQTSCYFQLSTCFWSFLLVSAARTCECPPLVSCCFRFFLPLFVPCQSSGFHSEYNFLWTWSWFLSFIEWQLFWSETLNWKLIDQSDDGGDHSPHGGISALTRVQFVENINCVSSSSRAYWESGSEKRLWPKDKERRWDLDRRGEDNLHFKSSQPVIKITLGIWRSLLGRLGADLIISEFVNYEGRGGDHWWAGDHWDHYHGLDTEPWIWRDMILPNNPHPPNSGAVQMSRLYVFSLLSLSWWQTAFRSKFQILKSPCQSETQTEYPLS